MLKCPYCDRPYKTYRGLAGHLVYKHNWSNPGLDDVSAWMVGICLCGFRVSQFMLMVKKTRPYLVLAKHLEEHQVTDRESLERHLVVEALKRQPNPGGFA